MASPKLIRSTIRRLLLAHPNLSNRAIARLAGASDHTVARLRPIPPRYRYEADGKRARGLRPGWRRGRAAQLRLPGF